MTLFFVILFISIYFQFAHCAPSGMNMAIVYLTNYGYLEANEMKMDSSDKKMVKKGIKQFQSFMRLPATGNINRRTMEAMSKPRCGVKDKTGKISKRFDKYSTKGDRWEMMLLSYKIVRYPTTMTKCEVDATIEKAFNAWSAHSNIMFKAVTSKMVDIEIMFVRGKHGDNAPFTGPGGVVAHANFPMLGGDVHFDDYETWTINTPEGTNLLQVAIHEIGHSLGLTHSDEFDAAMCPITRDYTANYKLHWDDINAIQNLYGMKNKSLPEPSMPVHPTEPEWESWWD